MHSTSTLMGERNRLRLERDDLRALDAAVTRPVAPTEHMRRCEHYADMVMLRALYLSWRSAMQETLMQRADGIVRFL